MPSTLSYPGVYIEELPSGVHTITGVATSITAFLGRAKKGPVNVATTVNSYGEFESLFGGLWEASKLAFAVRDFLLNGGGQAVIVSLYHTDAGGSAKPAKVSINVGALTFEAANAGRWGEALRVTVDVDVSAAVALSMGLTSADLFNLTITEAAPGGSTEKFRNLSVKDSPRRVDKVLAGESRLLAWRGVLNPASPPAIALGDDPIGAAEKVLAAAKAAIPQVPATIAAAEAALAFHWRQSDERIGHRGLVGPEQRAREGKRGGAALASGRRFH